MLLKLNDSKVFSEAVSIMSELVNEVRIKVSKNGMSAVAVDPANVSLVSLKMPRTNFSQFETSEEDLCVNLNDLKQILKRAPVGSSLTLERKENKLLVSIDGSVKRNFSLSLINIDSEEKQVPELEFHVKALMPSALFQQAVEDASVVSDACTFNSDGKSFSVESKGSLNSSYTEFDPEGVKFSGEGKAKYSLEYLQKFVKACKLSDNVHVQYRTDYPMRVDFFGPAELTFILAPRVEED